MFAEKESPNQDLTVDLNRLSSLVRSDLEVTEDTSTLAKGKQCSFRLQVNLVVHFLRTAPAAIEAVERSGREIEGRFLALSGSEFFRWQAAHFVNCEPRSAKLPAKYISESQSLCHSRWPNFTARIKPRKTQIDIIANGIGRISCSILPWHSASTIGRGSIEGKPLDQWQPNHVLVRVLRTRQVQKRCKWGHFRGSTSCSVHQVSHRESDHSNRTSSVPGRDGNGRGKQENNPDSDQRRDSSNHRNWIRGFSRCRWQPLVTSRLLSGHGLLRTFRFILWKCEPCPREASCGMYQTADFGSRRIRTNSERNGMYTTEQWLRLWYSCHCQLGGHPETNVQERRRTHYRHSVK